jgi:hypothetical protein
VLRQEDPEHTPIPLSLLKKLEKIGTDSVVAGFSIFFSLLVPHPKIAEYVKKMFLQTI